MIIRMHTFPGYANPWDAVAWDERFPPLSPEREAAFQAEREAAIQAEREAAPSRVYLIGMEGSPLVKIGVTRRLKKRLQSLQTGQPSTLSILWRGEGTAQLEQELHQRFAAQRVRGEWFDLVSLGDPVTVVQAAIARIMQMIN